MTLYGRAGKRALDIGASLVGLALLVPVLGGLWLAVRVQLGTPALFVQQRPGRDGRLFRMYKFRSMTNARPMGGALLPDSQRMTKLGTFLRRTSLDELPELVNVLKGDMSLVGPRPLLTEYLPLYSARQARRHEVRPGITGWAQINGRNALTWEQKFEYDTWYVDNMGFWLDLKILAVTVRSVVRREGISQPGQATAEPFRGSVRSS